MSQLKWTILLWCGLYCVPLDAAVRPLVVRSSDAADPSIRVTPEYARTMERLLIAIPEPDRLEAPDASVDGDGVGDINVDPRFVRAVFHELLSSVPDYSEIGIVARSRDRATVLGWDHLFDSHDNIHLHFIRQPESEVDLWAQDLGEYYDSDRQGVFLISALPHEKMAVARSIALSRERISRSVFRDEVEVADFVFEAGNLMFDETADGLRVIVGEDTLTRTISSARHSGRKPSETDVAHAISKQFGGAEVVVLRGEQFGGLIHIDQAFIVLRGGKIVLNSIPSGSSAERALLDGYQDQLETLGYEILQLETTVEDVRAYKTSTNALPYTHRETGQDTVIFPVFPGETAVGAPATLRSEHLIGGARRAFDLFRQAGYEPVPVRDVAHVSGGNTHCIANVLY